MSQTIRLPAFPVEGGCQCGAVRYQLTEQPRGVYRCHCKDCQRLSGAAFSLSMIISRSALQLSRGETITYRKTADSGRQILIHACPECGTKLWNEPLSAPDMPVLRPGTLDDAAWAAPVGNIWVGSKLPWVEIEDEFPAFPGQPASRDALYAAWSNLIEETA